VLVNWPGNFLACLDGLKTTQEQWDALMQSIWAGILPAAGPRPGDIKQKSGGSITTFSSLVAFPRFDPRVPVMPPPKRV